MIYFGLVWHINQCWLLNANSSLYIYIYILIYIYIYILNMICEHILLITFLYEPELIFGTLLSSFTQLNDQTVLFPTFKFSISHLRIVWISNSCIWAIDRTLSGTTTPGQSGPGSNDNVGVIHFPQSRSLTMGLFSFISKKWACVSYKGSALVFIPLMRFLLPILVLRSFLVLPR